jgi:drug/metabolite transporter (DMT)-like permease
MVALRLGVSLVFADDTRIIAILLAVVGAVFLSTGAQLQNDAVTKAQGAVATRGGLKLKQLMALLKRPRWLLGSLMLVLAVLFQLGALALAPLIVVQPVGAVALIITSVLNARLYKIRLNKKTIGAIALTFLGISTFVYAAASSAIETRMDDAKLLQVVTVLAVLLGIFGLLFYLSKGHVGPLSYIFGAGVLYGFVASLAKVVILRVYQGDYDWLTLIAVAALILATALGGWFVQNAYASGPPDLVIAGLTVIDPAVAIVIAILILQEAAEAGAVQIFAFVVSGIVAGMGVLMLARFHPQLNEMSK